MKSKKQKYIIGLIFACMFLVIIFYYYSINSKKDNVITVTIWHTYMGQMQIKLDTLVEEFNNTVGKEENIIIKATSVVDTSVIDKNIIKALHRDPGAPALPDIALIYPKIAVELIGKDMLVNFYDYLDSKEIAQYIPEFIEEGKLGTDNLYLLPIAKSTEVLYVNKTLFDRFANETGVKLSDLTTFEGLLDVSEKYYKWTDDKTPHIANDGKAFYYPDNLFNYTFIAFEQLGDTFIKEQRFDVSSKIFERVWNTYYPYAANGRIPIFDNYGNYLIQTGDIVSTISSTAGSIFYPSKITYADNTKEDIERAILPYPVFKGGKKVALQRGAGMCIIKSNEEKELACVTFLKWLTEPEQNVGFAITTGYLPVTKDISSEFIEKELANIKNINTKKSLSVAIRMSKEYNFCFPSVFDSLYKMQIDYVNAMQEIAKKDKNASGEISSDKRLEDFRNLFNIN